MILYARSRKLAALTVFSTACSLLTPMVAASEAARARRGHEMPSVAYEGDMATVTLVVPRNPFRMGQLRELEIGVERQAVVPGEAPTGPLRLRFRGEERFLSAFFQHDHEALMAELEVLLDEEGKLSEAGVERLISKYIDPDDLETVLWLDSRVAPQGTLRDVARFNLDRLLFIGTGQFPVTSSLDGPLLPEDVGGCLLGLGGALLGIGAAGICCGASAGILCAICGAGAVLTVAGALVTCWPEPDPCDPTQCLVLCPDGCGFDPCTCECIEPIGVHEHTGNPICPNVP